MPSQSFAATSHTTAPPEAAWTAMQDVETWRGIAGVDRVYDPRMVGADLAGFGMEATVAGAVRPGQAVVRRSESPRTMQVELTTTDIGATIDVVLAPVDDGSTVAVTVDVRTRSFLAGVFFPAVAAAIGAGIQSTVDGFAARLAT